MERKAEYEHIWRLIHIQEALAVTLASLMATRLAHVLSDTQDGENMNVLREALTGLRPDALGSDDDDDVEPSPWGGSIGAWIELLRRFGKDSLRETDPFLAALADYLSSTPNRPLAFGDAWARIAPVPATFRNPTLDRVGRLGAINSFRNKLAHVPVPQRILGDLHRGLRVEVLDGLTDKFNPENDSPGFLAKSYRDPLVGILYSGSTYVTGGSEVGIDTTQGRPNSVGIKASYGIDEQIIDWPVEPFFRIDGEAKAALLFRVTDLQREPGATGYGGEYHRFAAELEPVTYVTIGAEIIEPWIPRASPVGPEVGLAALEGQQGVSDHTSISSGKLPFADQANVLTVESTHSPTALRRLAEEAFSRRDYNSAVEYFDALAQSGDIFQYNHVAQSKHGAALWRAAERSAAADELQRSLQRAVELLKGAEKHRDPRYAARSAYEGSKALWHLWHATDESKHLLEALAAAERAVARSPDEAIISWQARVRADVDIAFPQGIPAPPVAPSAGDKNLPLTAEQRVHELVQLSIDLGRTAKYAEAVAAAKEAIQLSPTYAGAWRSLATNLGQLGQHDEAREAWRTHDQLTAKTPIDFESAASDALWEVQANCSSADAWEQLAKTFDRERRGGEAIIAAQKVLLDHPEAHASLLPLVEWLVSQLPDEIGGLVANMRRVAPDNTHYIHLYGVALRKAGRKSQAIEHFRTACEREPSNPSYWYALGRCHEESGEIGAAVEAFTKAVSCTNPPHLKAQERLKALQAADTCSE